MDPFTKNFEPIGTAYKIAIPLQIPPLPEFAQEPATLGDHLRRRRLELGLYQKDVAAQIGVTVSTIWNWEHGWTVDFRYIPQILTFHGYNPISCPEDPLDRLAWYKQAKGLNFEELGDQMGRDPEQLADWLSGRHKPCRRDQKEIERFMKSSEFAVTDKMKNSQDLGPELKLEKNIQKKYLTK